jgi:hypothetical protein
VKGPSLRYDLRALRVFRCAACGREVRLPAHRTHSLCSCSDPPKFMAPVDRAKAQPPDMTAFITVPTEPDPPDEELPEEPWVPFIPQLPPRPERFPGRRKLSDDIEKYQPPEFGAGLDPAGTTSGENTAAAETSAPGESRDERRPPGRGGERPPRGPRSRPSGGRQSGPSSRAPQSGQGTAPSSEQRQADPGRSEPGRGEPGRGEQGQKVQGRNQQGRGNRERGPRNQGEQRTDRRPNRRDRSGPRPPAAGNDIRPTDEFGTGIDTGSQTGSDSRSLPRSIPKDESPDDTFAADVTGLPENDSADGGTETPSDGIATRGPRKRNRRRGRRGGRGPEGAPAGGAE